MNTEVKDVNSLGADEIIVATGAKAKRIPVKGVENTNTDTTKSDEKKYTDKEVNDISTKNVSKALAKQLKKKHRQRWK